MASVVANSDSDSQHYACKCLNVRLQAAPATTEPPEPSSDPAYVQVFVGDEGIQVAHPQVTIRVRTRPTPIPGISRCSRFTTLTCLLCDLTVYRVFQISSPDIEGEDGPLLPVNDWVERETMKSSNGWIEIHKDCLVGTMVSQAATHLNYSTAFSLLLPPPSSRPSSPKMHSESPVSRTVSSSPDPPPSYLSSLRPLFPPPPFTPSHQTFLHLASLAEKESQAHRAVAEQQIAEVIREKVADIERVDTELRRQVEVLWGKYRRSINEIQKERNAHPPPSPENHKDRDHKSGVNGVGSPSATTIRDFHPVSVLNATRLSLSPAPRVSALSASLATTSFHYPRASQGRSSPQSNGSPDSASSQTLSSTHSGSLTLVQSSGRSEGSNVLQFRRNINDTINTAASFRYFVNLEEDMARHKRELQASSNQVHNNNQAGPSQPSENPITSGEKKKHNDQSAASESPKGTQVGEGPAGPRGRDTKGKRRVTFDVQPDVVNIKREAATEGAEEEALTEQDPREMIFELEDLDGADQSPKSRHTLPLIEQPAVSRPSRSTKSRQQVNGLPESFSSLRPSSLPAPSHIRPMRSQPGVDSSSQTMMMSLPRQLPPVSREAPRRIAEGKVPNARDAEILKLLAADTPSHRGAWKPDGKAWQTFTRRQDSKDHLEHENIPEESEYENGERPRETIRVERPGEDQDGDEDEDYDDFASSFAQIPSSLPINIISRSRQREVLSLASYQPKSTLAGEDEPEPPSTTHRASSSIAMRKAAYAERDRSRLMDPGALDFANEEVDEGNDDESDGELGTVDGGVDAGGRGRKRALKILQARSELPPSGMWRSLAS